MPRFVLLLCLVFLCLSCDEADDPVDIVESGSCSDGILNQDEVGTDCGGSCAPCAEITWNRLRTLGVWPAVDSSGQLVRQCGAGPIDGFLVNVSLSSTVRVDGDPDNSIHPGDVISGQAVDGAGPGAISLAGTQNLSVAVDCLDPMPDATGSSTCEGMSPAPTSGQVGYVSLAQRTEARNIMIVVDLSGSTSGFVDEGSLREHPADGSGVAPAQLQMVASDFGSLRWAQVKTLLEGLRATDRVGVLAFREGLEGSGLAAPCVQFDATQTDALAGLSWSDKLAACFGEGSDATARWSFGIDQLVGDKNWGRANLWRAVSEAWDFLAVAPAAAASHIIVISDGPDTCGTDENATDCQFACSEVSHQNVLESIAAGPGPQIHVVQFDSPGYPGPDPQQMEVACASGGHYQFINRSTLPSQNLAPFQAALGNALEAVRTALMGHWQIPVTSAALTSGQTPPGTVYSVAGSVTVEPSSGLVSTPEVTFLAGGEPGALDRRPKLTKACGGAADCGGSEAECVNVCGGGGVCLGGTAGVPAPNGTPCSAGVCCSDGGQGLCLAPGASCGGCQ